MTGAEALWGHAIKSLASIFVQAGWEKSTAELTPLIQQQIFRASRQYIKNYRRRHGILKVLGMSRPVSLDRVYTTVQFLDNQDIREFETVAALEKNYRKVNGRRFEDAEKEKQVGINVANQEQYLMVLGQPGGGKSTFLRKTGLEALKGHSGEYQHFCVPVFLELKRLDNPEVDLENAISKEFEMCGFPNSTAFTRKALRQGKLLILLDGLDEVPQQNLTSIIREIQDFTSKYHKNRFIASCRVAAYKNFFKTYTDVVVSAFSRRQIKQFINNWFRTELDKQKKVAEKCWKLLNNPDNAAALELAQTPLLLTFLCLVYDRSQTLFDNRSTLYKKALDILLEEWAAEKRIERGSIYQGLHTDLEQVLLSEFAYDKFTGDQLFFSKQTVIEHISEFLRETLNAPEHLDGRAVLDAIELQQGILVERARDVYSFSHLTIQEFLAARYVAKDWNKLRRLISSVRLLDIRWREVFLLATGLQDSADKILEVMEKNAQQYIRTRSMRRLMQMLAECSKNIQGDGRKSAKRAMCAAGFLQYACSRRQSIADQVFLEDMSKQAHALSKILDDKSSLRYLEVQDLDLQISLESQELNDLNSYLTATLVMVQCKQAALRVSPRVWHQIEARVLTSNLPQSSQYLDFMPR